MTLDRNIRQQRESVQLDVDPGADFHATDLTAVVAAFRDEGEGYAVLSWFFVPADNIRGRADRDKVPYPRWRDDVSSSQRQAMSPTPRLSKPISANSVSASMSERSPSIPPMRKPRGIGHRGQGHRLAGYQGAGAEWCDHAINQSCDQATS